ncbi:hypothetical protein [Actinoplanes sp. N902-109]|nr:hypothetical protein [Actinoplanes sp. N902-109]AGL16138.1 hypothetical protein L083_2628 [Actinoplanes sp. N902-109]
MQARTDTAARYTMIARHSDQPTAAMARLTALFESKLRAAGVRIPRSDPH